MKKIVLFPVVFSIFLLNIAGTCCDDDTAVVNSVTKSLEDISATLNQGTWRVSYFFDGKINKSSSFLDYNFIFGPNDVLMANNSSVDYSGKWTITKSEVAANNSNNDLNFTISFSNAAALMDLSDGWDIVDLTATQVRLRGINSENGQTDYLTFEKN